VINWFIRTAGTSGLLFISACQLDTDVDTNSDSNASSTNIEVSVSPVYVTEKVQYDTDDPAIYVDPDDPAQSFILGTDKNEDGALYAFDLKGQIIEDKVVRPLLRPNNTDLEYQVGFGRDSVIDIAVVAERLSHKIRVFSLPDMKPLDNGGIDAFVGEEGEGFRDLMGIACYRNPQNGKAYVIVGRKNGPSEGYLWQYELVDDYEKGVFNTRLVRKFGKFSGEEIEAIAVDDELGYVYYCDEKAGIRKYHADPAKGDEELALFGQSDFKEDNEGIAIYKTGKGKGYLFVSDQQAGRLLVYPREGSAVNPHDHKMIKGVDYKAKETDGIEITNTNLGNDFPKGLLVAMSDDKTFHLYSMQDILTALEKQ